MIHNDDGAAAPAVPLVALVHADAVLLSSELRSTAESVWKDFLVVAEGVPPASR
jgi:hypothetical protein